MARKLALVGLVLMLPGCVGTLASQTFHTVAGPLGRYDIIDQRAEKAQMARYKNVEIVMFENTIPTMLKENVVETVQMSTVAILSRSGNLSSVIPVASYHKSAVSTPTLVITGTLIDVTKDSLPGQRVISNANHLIARVKLIDKGSGTVLVEANLRGYVKSAIDLPQESLAKGLARAADRLLREVCGWEK